MTKLGLPPTSLDSNHEGGMPEEMIDVEWGTGEQQPVKNPNGSLSSSFATAGTFASADDHHPLNGAGQRSSVGVDEHSQHTPREAQQHSPSAVSALGPGDHTRQQHMLQAPASNAFDTRRPRLALLVFCIVALNVGVFLVIMYINDCPKTNNVCFLPFLHRFSFQPLRENALIGPSSQTLERLGALDAIKVQHAHQGWRLISCIWLHAGVVHVLVNMLSLLFIGVRLEQEFGPGKIGIIYLLSGFGGSLLSVLFLQSVSVGASGALFGLVGAMLAELLANWTIYANKCTVTSVLVFVVAANLAMGIFPFVDNFAHIGGLIVGFLSGLVLLMNPQYGFIKASKLPPGHSNQSSATKPKYNAYQYFLWVTAILLLIVGFISIAILVFRGENGNNKCKWCHYLSCVPTSKWKCHNNIACDEIQVGNMWQITCTSNQKSTLAPLNQTQDVLQELCTQLCS